MGTIVKKDELSQKSKQRQSAESQNNNSKQLIKVLLQNWRPEESQSYQFFNNQFPRLNKDILLSIAKILKEHFGLDLNREAYRNKNVLYKWFDDHFEKFRPILETKICITDADYKPLMRNSKPGLQVLEAYKEQQKMIGQPLKKDPYDENQYDENQYDEDQGDEDQ